MGIIIYKTTNLVNGKIYIGQYSGKKKGYLGSGTALKNAITKYGKVNFKRETLEEVAIEIAGDREEFWIQQFDARNREIGYNIAHGGKSFNLGITFTKEHKNKISFAHKGKKRTVEMSTEWKRKLGIAHKGKPKSDDQKRKLSEANKGKHENTYFKIYNQIREYDKDFLKEIGIKGSKVISRRVGQYALDNVFVREYESISSASREIGITVSNIVNCLHGKQKTAGGYKWKYCDEDLHT